MKIYLLDCSKLQKLCAQEGFPEKLCTKVDSFRRQKALGMKQEKSRAMSLAAGLVLQLVWKDYEAEGIEAFREDRTEVLLQPETLLDQIQTPTELAYEIGKQGKPYFKGRPFYFNLSHSGEYVICVASEEEVGVDLQEKLPIDTLRLAERFFHEREVQELRSLDSQKEREKLFYQMWTKKEACGKLTGQGVGSLLGHNLKEDRTVCFLLTDQPDGYIGCIARYQQPYGKEN